MEDLFSNITLGKVLIQLLGFGAMAACVLSFQAKTRLGILGCQFLGNTLWMVHMLFLNAAMGALMQGVAAVRGAVFASGERYVFARHPAMMWIFSGIILVLGIMEYKSPLDCLTIFGTVFSTFVFFARDPQRLRYLAIFASSPWLIYDIYVCSIAGICSESFTLVSIFIALYRFHRRTQMNNEEMNKQCARNNLS